MTHAIRLCFLLTIAAALVAGRAAPAQDLDFEVFEDVLVDEAEDPARAARAFGINMDREQFDRWVLGSGSSVTQARRHLHQQLTLQVESIDRMCDLSEAQKSKLELAGRGDIERFFGELEERRMEFMNVRHDRQEFNRFWHEKISPLQNKFKSGIFDDDSLLHKVLDRTLDTEQLAEYEQAESQRRRFHYEAKVAMTVAILEKRMPLSDEQRQRFIKLILEETEPPRKLGQHSYQIVLYQASKVPEEKVKPIFDDGQWRDLQAHFEQAKAAELRLKQNGLIP